MKQESNSEKIKQFLSIFGQLGGFVASIVILIQTFTGSLDNRYAQTLSAMAALVLTGLIWFWRWPRIAQTKSRSPAKRTSNRAGSFLKPFQASHGRRYVLSLTRRRVEGVILILITILSIGLAGGKTPRIIEEISGLHCSYAVDRDAPLVIVAEFNNLTDIKTTFVDRLFTSMVGRFENEISVCRSREVVKEGLGARELGKSLNGKHSTTIVIWGDSDDRTFEIHITPIEWTAFDASFKADTGDSAQLEDWAKDYLPQIILGEVRYIEGDGESAVGIFEDTIRNFKNEIWSADNEESLVSMYLLLAFLYEDDGQVQSAIDAYSQALFYDETLGAARLNRGGLYMANDPEKAMADFDELIRRDSDFAADAYINRANLQPDWEKAKNDYLSAIAIDPENPYYYHWLGLTALYYRDFDIAYKAYKDSLKYLDSDTRDSFIEDLNIEVQDNESLREDVEKIIDMLEKEELN